jgi:protein-S-isoprenylcysteine O-methyltransferase Ste14
LPSWLGEPENISFFVAMFFSLPFFIVTFRKFHEIGIQVAQVSLASEKHPPKRLKFIRQIISNTILIAGVIGVVLWILAVSSTLYSSRPFIIGMLFVLGIIVILFWKYIIRIYSKGQSALKETLSEAER